MVNNNDLESILAQVLEEVKQQEGRANLAEISRRTGISRARLRKWAADGYRLKGPDKAGRKRGSKKLEGPTAVIDESLQSGVTNSSIIHRKLRSLGYTGGLTILKDYIRGHRDLVPANRQAECKSGNRGRRYETSPGDCYQMDWGFVNVDDGHDGAYQYACFAMVCHHCGYRYVEFFPNARQENLLIGMLHAFSVMGVPKRVLTDNMKSVVVRRDPVNGVVYNPEYAAFQEHIGFRTDLCKVGHAYTKGRVERLVRFVKDNMVARRSFVNLNDLNKEALRWCSENNGRAYRESGIVPALRHPQEGHGKLPGFISLFPYLAPARAVSFDGFVEYEGRRYGVPLSYRSGKARVMRDGEILYVLDYESGARLAEYNVDWARASKCCPGQWSEEYGAQPEELPTNTVRVSVSLEQDIAMRVRFARFGSGKPEGGTGDE